MLIPASFFFSREKKVCFYQGEGGVEGMKTVAEASERDPEPLEVLQIQEAMDRLGDAIEENFHLVTSIEASIEEAKKNGLDTKSLEERFLLLQSFAYGARVKVCMEAMEDSPLSFTEQTFHELEQKISEAEEAGANMTEVRSTLSEFYKKVLTLQLETMIMVAHFTKLPDGANTHAIEPRYFRGEIPQARALAEKYGVNTQEIFERMEEFLRT